MKIRQQVLNVLLKRFGSNLQNLENQSIQINPFMSVPTTGCRRVMSTRMGLSSIISLYYELDEKIRGRKKKGSRKDHKGIFIPDDEPDPTAYMGNYNFPQMLFAFCLGFVTMFVLSVNEINEFKGCPLGEYFQREVKG